MKKGSRFFINTKINALASEKSPSSSPATPTTPHKRMSLQLSPLITTIEEVPEESAEANPDLSQNNTSRS